MSQLQIVVGVVLKGVHKGNYCLVTGSIQNRFCSVVFIDGHKDIIPSSCIKICSTTNSTLSNALYSHLKPRTTVSNQSGFNKVNKNSSLSNNFRSMYATPKYMQKQINSDHQYVEKNNQQLSLLQKEKNECIPSSEKSTMMLNIDTDSTTLSSEDSTTYLQMNFKSQSPLLSPSIDESDIPKSKMKSPIVIESHKENIETISKDIHTYHSFNIPSNYDINKQNNTFEFDSTSLSLVGLSMEYDHDRFFNSISSKDNKSIKMNKYLSNPAYTHYWNTKIHKHTHTSTQMCHQYRFQKKRQSLNVFLSRQDLISNNVPYSSVFHSLPKEANTIIKDYCTHMSSYQNTEQYYMESSSSIYNESMYKSSNPIQKGNPSTNHYSSIEDWYVDHKDLWKKVQDRCRLRCSQEDYNNRYSMKPSIYTWNNSTIVSDPLKSSLHHSEQNELLNAHDSIKQPVTSMDQSNSLKIKPSFYDVHMSTSPLEPLESESQNSETEDKSSVAIRTSKEKIESNKHQDGISGLFQLFDTVVKNKTFIEENKQSLDKIMFSLEPQASLSYSIPDMNGIETLIHNNQEDICNLNNQGFALLYGYHMHYTIQKQCIVIGQLDKTLRHKLNQYCYQSFYNDQFGIDLEIGDTNMKSFIKPKSVTIFNYNNQWYIQRLQKDYIYLAVNDHLIMSCNECYPLAPVSLIYIHSTPIYFLQAK